VKQVTISRVDSLYLCPFHHRERLKNKGIQNNSTTQNQKKKKRIQTSVGATVTVCKYVVEKEKIRDAMRGIQVHVLS
jgi:hypothetical protein